VKVQKNNHFNAKKFSKKEMLPECIDKQAKGNM
jgi:hypothetical protein